MASPGKKILIVSFYFPPCNCVASERILSWVKYFPQTGLQPTVITRQWTGNESKWEDYLRLPGRPTEIKTIDNVAIHYLEYRHTFLYKIISQYLKNWALIRNLAAFFFKLIGNLQFELNGYKLFLPYIENILKKEKFDYLLISVPPFNSIKLGSYLKRKYNIPYIIDFRDLWNNDVLKHQYSPTLSEKIHNGLARHYINKYISASSLISVISYPMIDILKKNTSKDSIEITHGYESYQYITNNNNSKFTVSVIGMLYPKQNLEIITKGINKFISDKNYNEVQFRFIGLEAIAEVADKVKTLLPKEFIYTCQRISRNEATKEINDADILLYSGWTEYKGIYSGKIFDYLGAHKPILIAPGDNNVIDNLLHQTNSGKTANNIKEFCDILNDWYLEWKKNGYIQFYGKTDEIEKYSRRNKALEFANAIKSI